MYLQASEIDHNIKYDEVGVLIFVFTELDWFFNLFI